MSDPVGRMEPWQPDGHRLIIVSNRLPATVRIAGGRIESEASSGGLAAALAGVMDHPDTLWIGWPGSPIPRSRQAAVAEVLQARRLTPVFLNAEEQDGYYDGICNNVFWPLFHYFTGRVSFRWDAWKHYVDVNYRFAEAVLATCRPGDRVWVHDFHLMLLPSILRERMSGLEIGFFLHIPFPSAELYRLLPVREEVLHGLLGADYIGFHTADYARHFRTAGLRVLGLETEPGKLTFEGRQIGIGVNPIGADVATFRSVLGSPEAAAAHAELEQRYRGRKLILGVERLDYTKGVALKLQAFERFLQRFPERVRDVTLLQVLVPSRLAHPHYRRLKSEIEELIGKLNGTYGSPGCTPIEYLHRSVAPPLLAALYRFADVGLVTPVRDGMNLVAHEFVLCQGEAGPGPRHKGILALSEFAGAAHHLPRALLVNPWSVEQTAAAIERALAMPARERAERMASMAISVARLDCREWAAKYLGCLAAAAARQRAGASARALEGPEAARAHERMRAAARCILVLDYDGTLRELTRTPDEATPTQDILALLLGLSARPGCEVHIVSGRRWETLDAWLGQLPIHLCAEHGYLAREPGADWRVLLDAELAWLPAVEETLRRVADEVPGTLVERKTSAVAWHYRLADLDYGEWRARELRAMLEQELANVPVEVIAGHRVIEVRVAGAGKGRYVRGLAAGVDDSTLIVCAGDDRSDQDMFRALPASGISIQIGADMGGCTHTLESPRRLRAFLRGLLAG